MRDTKSYRRNFQNRLYLIKNTYVDQILLAKMCFAVMNVQYYFFPTIYLLLNVVVPVKRLESIPF